MRGYRCEDRTIRLLTNENTLLARAQRTDGNYVFIPLQHVERCASSASAAPLT